MFGIIQGILCLYVKNKQLKKVAFCFDLDGTVTMKEILPIIAREVDLYEEISILTDATMKGLIPFESSFKLRVRLLSSISISAIQNIVFDVPLNPDIQKFIQENKTNCYIVTGNLEVWVGKLIEEVLGCKYFSSTTNVENNEIQSIKKVLNKGDVISLLRKEYDTIITVGDGMNDCAMFEKADIGIAYGGIHNPVDSLIDLSNYVVLNSKSLVNLLNNFK